MHIKWHKFNFPHFVQDQRTTKMMNMFKDWWYIRNKVLNIPVWHICTEKNCLFRCCSSFSRFLWLPLNTTVNVYHFSAAFCAFLFNQSNEKVVLYNICTFEVFEKFLDILEFFRKTNYLIKLRIKLDKLLYYIYIYIYICAFLSHCWCVNIDETE